MAGRLILTTVGTSALLRAKLDLFYLGQAYEQIRRLDLPRLKPAEWRGWIGGERPPSNMGPFIESYTSRLVDQDIETEVHKPPHGTNAFSAELTSLYLMYQSKQHAELGLDPEADSHALLLSDSPEGVLAGLITQRCLSSGKFLDGRSVSPQCAIVSGLQVENFSKFFPDGLKAFVQCVLKFTQGEPTKTPILNTSGGFKSLIPYTTYLSLAWQIPMVFVFEELAHVIRIHPAPINPTRQQEEMLLGMRRAVQRILAEQMGMDPVEV